jgi:hypothetical protein
MVFHPVPGRHEENLSGDTSEVRFPVPINRTPHRLLTLFRPLRSTVGLQRLALATHTRAVTFGDEHHNMSVAFKAHIAARSGPFAPFMNRDRVTIWLA